MRIIRFPTPDWLSDAENYPLMIANPSLDRVILEYAREQLGLPEDVAVVLSPYVTPVQVFRMNRPAEAEWVGRVGA